MRAVCWLAQFSDKPCEGRMDPAHLLAKNRMRQEHVPEEAIWDPRVWVPACRTHHAALDTARTLRVPRERLPEGLERFVEEYGLEWLLSRSYGERMEAA